MSKRTKKEMSLLVLYGLSVVASIFGIVGGSFLAVCDTRKYIALVVVSAILLIGSAYGIYYETYVKRAKRKIETKKIRKSNLKIIIWGFTAIGSGTGLVLHVIFGAEFLDYRLGLYFLFILAGSCFLSGI